MARQTLPVPDADLVSAAAGALEALEGSVTFVQGSFIFRENDEGQTAYLIERGRVRIAKHSQGEDKMLAEFGPGELIGEMAAIDGGTRSATAIALTDTELVPISRERMARLIAASDPIVGVLLRILLDRLRTMHQELDGDAGRATVPGQGQDADAAYDLIRSEAISRLRMERAMRTALSRREFNLHYQPLVDIKSRRTVGFEALLRWAHPESGQISPADFIPMAEQTGLIVPIGRWVLEHAARMLVRLVAECRHAGKPADSLFMSVNLSARQLLNPREVDTLIDTVAATGIDPRSLKLEITEHILIENPEVAAASLRKFRDTGITLAIDDFGTGYSSLSYLNRFPLDVLKIDQAFVSAMLDDNDSLQVVRAITQLAHALEMDVVAEGVEQQAQLDALAELGAEFAQGYLFSRPVPFEAALALLLDEA